ncbi:MAG: fatty acid desaturase [Flavobacteriales bacterium]|nr:fatty acid desaturase [Flavobacteriales bacterium]
MRISHRATSSSPYSPVGSTCIEHHLFPYISHLHYPEIAPIVQRTAEEHGLHYNVKPTMRKAMRSHMQRLWDLGHIGKIAQ